MFITEYDEERAFAEQREDAREEGRAEGMLSTLFALVKKGILTLSQAAEEAHMPEAEFKLQMEQM